VLTGEIEPLTIHLVKWFISGARICHQPFFLYAL
jgi:hypothetical protein